MNTISREKELIAAKERMEAILNLQQEMICRFTPDTTLTFVNDAYCKAFGKSREELIGNPFLDLVPKEEHPKILKSLKELLQSKKPITYEHQVFDRDGNIVWQEWTDYLALTDDTETIEFQSVGSDITDRKKTEYQLQGLATVVEQSDDSVVVKDLDMRVVAANQAFAKAAGHKSVKTIIGKTDVEIFGGSPDAEAFNSFMADERKAQTLKAGDFILREESFTTASGKKKTGLIKIFPIFNNAGKLLGTGNVMIDITEKVKTKITLEKERDFFRQVIDTIPGFVCVKDISGRFALANKELSKAYGTTIERLEGNRESDFNLKPEEIESFIEDDTKVISNKETIVIPKERFTYADGSIHWLSTTKTPIIEKDGSCKRLLAVALDITDRIEIQEKLKESEDRFQNMLSVIPDMISMQDCEMNIIYSNWNGYASVAEEKRMLHTKCYKTYRGYDQTCQDCQAKEAIISKKPVQAEVKLIDGNWVDVRVIPVLDENNNIKFFVEWVRDISDRKQMERIIFNEKEQFKTTLLSVGDGIISTDNQGNVMIMNQIAEKLTGWSLKEAYGKPLYQVFHIIHEYTRERCENPVQKVLSTGDIIELANHTMLISKNGKEIPIEDSAAPIKDSEGKITGVVLVFRDFTEKKEKQKQIEYISYHDYLTDLYNRRYMEDMVKRLDTECNLPFTIMVLDVNGLKLTNDAFGHEMGDELLKTVAQILKKACRANDIVGRIGGDEFAILLPDTDKAGAEKIKRRIVKAAAEAKMESVIVSLAVGYAVKEKKEQEIEEIQIKAENNMYKNKLKSGRVMRNQTIENVVRNINLKYDQEQIHTERVSQYCEAIARAMELSEKEIIEIKTAAVLHDIGKIMVPTELLNKSSKLTEEEFEIIKRHPETGYQILKSVDEYAALAEAVLYHHEHWDGEGYPEGLQGKEIPFISRIIAVADAYEAMTARRPYHKTKNKEEAIAEVKRCAGSQFDPELVRLFVDKVL